jgi:hypothetical protein
MKAEDPADDATLLTRINAAVVAANEAERSVATAQAELVSRSKAVGLLLLEAKKLHPKVKDFEEFLKRVDGLKLSRAYDLLRLAGGRTTDEELRKDARDRQQRSREKKKTIPRPTPALKKPDPDFRDITEKSTDTKERKPSEQKVYDSPQEVVAGVFEDFLKSLRNVVEKAKALTGMDLFQCVPDSDAKKALAQIPEAENALRRLREKLGHAKAESA